MKNLLCLAIIGGLMLTGATFGQTSDNNNPALSASGEELYSVDYAVVEMETEYQIWADAVLRGEQDQAKKSEATLLALVNRDIFVYQEKVRKLALEIALASSEKLSEAPDQPQTDEQLELKATFQASIDRLNTKETLYRSALRTNAFSNKYRLLGDYINILRRELDLPKLKLAEADKDATPGPERRLPSGASDQ